MRPVVIAVAAALAPLTALGQPPDPEPARPPLVEGELADVEPAEATPAFEDPSFGPQYLIERIEVRGNRKTRADLILREIGLRAGDVVTGSDRRVELARFRLLSLGYFVDVRLSLSRGSRRGAAVLLVEIEERGTMVLSAVYLGTSEATAFWGGLELSETNFLGRGISVGGGFVGSTEPTVPGAARALGLRLRAGHPSIGGSGVGLSGTAILSDGSEFFRAFGTQDDVDPTRFVAVRSRRLGGVLGLGNDISRSTRLYTDGRFESVDATLPALRTRDRGNGTTAPIDFGIHEGQSRVASLASTLDIDTRSDPVLPQTGGRLILTVEVASPIFGSSYAYAKGLVLGSIYKRVRGRHVVGLHVMGGAIFGDAPYFDQFFIGDLNLLLPPRALGINFSTLPSRDLLGTSIERHRYDDFAARAMVEYAVPLWRRRGFVYGGDAFAAVGVLGMASLDDLRVRDTSLAQAVPIDLTADVGLRLDTYVGIFTLSIANALGRIPF